MIRETIVTTRARDGYIHLAPMGIHETDGGLAVMPFRPSATLENLQDSREAVINYTDDIRVFAGCLTGRRDWPLMPAKYIEGKYLANALAHAEVEVVRMEEHEARPCFHCRVLHEATHAPFRGFNRAQYSVLEAAILVSRLHRLPWEKVESELAYLRIGLEKSAGDPEREAWGWLMEAVEAFKRDNP